MRVEPKRGALVGGGLGAFFLIVSVSAAADSTADRARCKASYEQAQVLSRDEHLEAARSALLVCKETCPAQLSRDCETWLRDVAALMPTVQFEARDALGRPLTDARVTVDGRLVAVPFAAPIALEPGAHVFRFERVGFTTTERRADVHAGERARAIAVILEPVEPPRAPASTTPAWIVGGVGSAALVGAGVLTLKGYLDRSSLLSSCAPGCTAVDVDAIRTEWWAAAGLGAAGAILVGVGVWLWPWGDRATSSAAVPTLMLAPRALALRWAIP